MNEDKPCGGCISYDADGNQLKRWACEVHLFDPGTCPWEQKRRAEEAEP